MKTVYVLGAGFSKPAGAPLGDELLGGILDQGLKSKGSTGKSAVLRDVVAGLKELFPKPSVWTLEQILTIVNSEALFEIITRRSFGEAETLRRDLLWAVIFIIADSIGENAQQDLYNRFVTALRPRDALISLNYDIIVENALYRRDRCFDAGIPKDKLVDTMEGPWCLQGVPVLKIHGSSNLMRCADCRKWLVKNWKIVEEIMVPWAPTQERFPVCPGCKGKLLPVIVPPSLEKAGVLSDVKVLWERAAKELQSADRVTFIGTSLNPADFDLEALLRMTLAARGEVPIEVVSKTLRPARRFQALFPRHHITLHSGGFEDWMNVGNSLS